MFFFPILTLAASAQDLTIGLGATLDLGGFGLTLSGLFSNAGILRLVGDETLTGFTNDVLSGLDQSEGRKAGYDVAD